MKKSIGKKLDELKMYNFFGGQSIAVNIKNSGVVIVKKMGVAFTSYENLKGSQAS